MTLATVVVGAIGGIIRLLNVVVPTDPWIGVSLVTLAMILSASVVFSAGLFFAPEVAGRAFYRSLALGLGLSLLVVPCWPSTPRDAGSWVSTSRCSR